MSYTQIYVTSNLSDYDIEILNKLNIKSHQIKNDESKDISYKTWYFLYTTLLSEYKVDLVHDGIYYQNNKPYTKNIYFNISHSKNLAAIIISDKECSIDIEYIDDNRNIDRISNRVFGKTYEITDFYKQWTLYEAKMKFNGEMNSKTMESFYLKEYNSFISYVSTNKANLKIVN